LSNILDGWNETEEWKTPNNYIPKTIISVVIASRNEEKFIGQCIESILSCNYPKELYEIIIVNDHSEDKTAEVIKNFNETNVLLLNLEETFGKKNALELGIKRAKGKLIACTDADCQVPTEWLRSFANHFENTQSQCIAGPISYFHDNSLLQRFQYLDALNNMCVTVNGIKRKSYYMGNGANLFFTKDAFLEIGGYQRNAEYASGDDMFLIQEIASRYPDNISFLKSKKAIVKTQPETSFLDLVNQRTRWATKSKAYSNKNIIKIQGFVFYFVSLILLNLLVAAFGVGACMIGLILAILIKLAMDNVYLSKLASYFGDRSPMNSFIGASLAFMIYIIFAGIKALLPTAYNWKGRKTK
jgi:cellulose synthase/poly-beta-1,6-N-acetylglucosamine synthase-like glycosyltransferase